MIVSRSTTASSHETETWPIKLAFADSIPSTRSRTPPRRMTQRSHLIPLTWSVSERVVTRQC